MQQEILDIVSMASSQILEISHVSEAKIKDVLERSRDPWDDISNLRDSRDTILSHLDDVPSNIFYLLPVAHEAKPSINPELSHRDDEIKTPWCQVAHQRHRAFKQWDRIDKHR
jgi:hypothetical protein